MSTAIRDVWPSDLRVIDPITPIQILQHQANALADRTKGVLTATIQTHTPVDRVVWGFDVHSPVLGKIRLFEVHGAKDLIYPVRLFPPDVNIPSYLRRKRYLPGEFEEDDDHEPLMGAWIENEWVASTPEEFTEKLEKLLASDEVKSLLMSFLSGAKREDASK